LDVLAVFIIAIVATGVGLVIGWLVGGRAAAGVRAELAAAQVRADQADAVRGDLIATQAKLTEADVELSAWRERASSVDVVKLALGEVTKERDEANIALARAQSEREERERAFAERMTEWRADKDLLTAQFNEIAGKIVDDAQAKFLERADARFKQSEDTAGQSLKALLQPVHERLTRYEEGVAKVETQRRDAFGELKGQIEAMRVGQEKVSVEAAKIVNSLRSAPKVRGNWGERQLRNVLESCGLSEHIDFETEVSVTGDDGGRLRPDAILRVPGGKMLVIDAKVSLNAYQDAFDAVDEKERKAGLDAHAVSMRNHVGKLSERAYWNQFEEAPDYVIMFVPGEHFVSAATEHDSGLWQYAFDKRVIISTPANLVAIARTVSAVWRQEKLAKEARQIGELGKELYDRLAKVGDDLGRAGASLNNAVTHFNKATTSFNTRLTTTGKRFRDLDIDTGQRTLEDVAPVEALATHAAPLAIAGDAAAAANVR
jgi:DNA recombination protein RmuC